MSFGINSIFFFFVIALLAFIFYEVLPRVKNAKNIKSELNAGGKQKVNAIAEAEVYLAYGRKAQAIEVLEQALAKEPNNFEIINKLNELKVVN